MERYRLSEDYIIEAHGGSLFSWHRYVLGTRPATDELIGGRARVMAGVLHLQRQDHSRGAFKSRDDIRSELAAIPKWESTLQFRELPEYGGGLRDCRTGAPKDARDEADRRP